MKFTFMHYMTFVKKVFKANELKDSPYMLISKRFLAKYITLF